MKDKLEVGHFIRTIKGIGRIEEITEDKTEIYFNCDTGLTISFIKKDFTQEEMAQYYKHSDSIIDLIEEGDYVNGYKIDYINLNCETPFLRSNQPYRVDNTLYSTLIEKGKDYNQPLHFYEEDIKTILTKEQFENNCYNVEEQI